MSFSGSILSQELEIDSLLSALDTMTDTKEKVNILTSVSFKLAGKNDSLALSYAHQGIQLSEDITYSYGIAEGYRGVGQVYNFGGKYGDARKEFEKAKALYEKIGNKERIATIINDIGITYTLSGDLDKATSCFHSSIQIAKELKDTGKLTSYYSNNASIFQRQGNTEQAIEEFERLSKLDSASNQFAYYAEDLGNLAICYLLINMDNKALEYALKGYEIADSLGVLQAAYTNSSVIGEIYRNIGNLKSSEYYFKVAVEKATQIGNSSLIGYGYNNLEITYLAMDSVNLALSCLDSALLYIPPTHKHSVLNNIGLLYASRLNNLDSAIVYYDKAIQAAKDMSMPLSQVGPLFGKGLALNKKGNLKQAVALIRQGISISPNLDNVDFADKQQTMRDISDVFRSSGDYKSGYLYLFKAIEIQDSLLSGQHEKQAKLLDYEKRIRQLQIKEQELDLKEQERKLRENQYLFWGFGLLVFLAILFAIIIFNRNKKLVLVNNRIEYLSNEIHHRVKNDFQSIASLIFVQQNEIQDNQIKQTLLGVRDRVLAMGQIHMLFYVEGHYFKIGLAKYLHDLVEKRTKALASQYVAANVNVKIDVDKSIEQRVSFDEAKQLGIVINELITNVFKHAFKDHQSPIINFKAVADNESENLMIQVIDNGLGIEAESAFRSENSFGLKMIRATCKQLGWKFQTESPGPEQGSTFTLTINTKK